MVDTACTDGSGQACEHNCCFLACRCWLDIRIRLDMSPDTKLLLLIPALLALGVSAANMIAHAQKYRTTASEEPLNDQRSGSVTLYLRMRLAFILVLTAPPVLGTVSWLQLYFGGHAAEADAIVMVYEAVAINCYLQMVIAYCGGRQNIAKVLETKGHRVLWAIPITELPADASARARRCISCCMRYNCKLYTFGESAGLLRFWELSVLQMLPVKTILAVLVVATNRLMVSCTPCIVVRCVPRLSSLTPWPQDDQGESWRIPINVANVVSMIMAIRANVALYFELKSQLAGMRPLLKYLSCRMVLSACLSQRFLLDVTIVDPDARFELLNLLIVVEMAVRYINSQLSADIHSERLTPVVTVCL